MFDIMEIVSRYHDIITNQNHERFDELLHELVASELSSNAIKNGLLLKAAIEADGNQDKTKIVYAKLRIDQLKKEIIQAAIIYDKAVQEQILREQKTAEAEKRKEMEIFNSKHKVCQYCNSVTDISILVCPRCHLPL